MQPFCYLNGVIMPVAEARVSVYDIGLLRGYGIYEALTTSGGAPFMWKEHVERFRASAARLEITVPASDEELRRAVDELTLRNGYAETNIKFILTGGVATNSIEYDPDSPTFYILAEEFMPLPEKNFTDGCSLVTFECQRQLPEYKTIDYLQAVMLQKMRKEKGALEVLYTWKGNALEAATSNFFIVRNGVLVTPLQNVLHGITRKAVIECAKPHFKIEERDIAVEEIFSADEAFITSSFKEIVPIVQIDGKPIGEGKVGPVAPHILALFREFAAAHSALAADTLRAHAHAR